MAFAIRNLSILTYANGHTQWLYNGLKDTLETIAAPGFFQDASDMLTRGDLITIVGKDAVGIRWVSRCNKATVIVSVLA